MRNLVVGALIISFAPILVKAAGEHLGPTAIAFYRCGVAFAVQALILACFPRLRPSRALMCDRRVWAACLGAGFFFALDMFVWNRSVIYTGAGMGTILGNTQVFYLAAIGVFFLKERVSRRFLFSVPAAFLGVFLLTAYQAPAARGEHYALGVVCGLLTGVFYALFMIYLRKAERILGVGGTLWNLFLVSAGAAVFLFAFAVADGSLEIPEGAGRTWVVLLALGPQTCGWLLIAAGLSEVPVSKTGLVLLIQPVLATLWGVGFFAESYQIIQVAGASLTLGAVYLGAARG